MSDVKRIDVAVAVVVRGGLVLITQRKADDSFAHHWEFPGGKCEPGEAITTALRRELREELAVDVTPTHAFDPITHRYPSAQVTLHPFECTVDASASPQPLECQAMKWVAPADLPAHRFPPANGPLLAAVAARITARPTAAG